LAFGWLGFGEIAGDRSGEDGFDKGDPDWKRLEGDDVGYENTDE
jgi:hypothetical protein